MSVFALAIAASLLLTFTPVADDQHIVERGDTLSRIAAEYDVSVVELVRVNDLADPNLIVVGEMLRIPGTNVIHQVQRGETLSQIARKYGTTVAELASANGIIDINRIIAGSTLTISGDVEGGDPEPEEESEPAPPPTVGTGVTSYMIVRGDTLSAIARRFGTTVSHLMELNDIANPDAIRSGQKLIVPGEGFTCPVAGSAVYINDWHFPRPGGRIHLGTDIFAPSGTAVVAPVSGTIEQIDGAVGGLQFWLTGDDGNLYIGSHMSDFGLGGRVKAGDLIGYIGQTGNAKSTPPHLHFEIIVDGAEVNPYPTLVANGC